MAHMGLTEAEWQVMECLWAAAPQTGRAIIDALHDSRNINLISDVQVAMQETDGKASVQVSMTVTYYELKK